MRGALLLILGLGLLAPATASADNRLTIVGGEATFYSDDPGYSNTFVVEDAGPSEVRFYEPTDASGMGAPPQCRPGQLSPGGNPAEVFCPKSQITKGITIDGGPAEDTITYNVRDVLAVVAGNTGADTINAAGNTGDILTGDQGNDTADGGTGNDELRGEDGNDTLRGGDGNDKIYGGTGADTIDGGAGDDSLDTADGVADKVQCGAGTDAVVADTADELDGCETVDRRVVAPPADQPAGDDSTKPTLQAGGSASQRVSSRRRSVRFYATSSEKGIVEAAGFVQAAGINSPLKRVSRTVGVAGGGVTVVMRFSKRQMRGILRDLRRKRRVWVRITVSSTDAAGNTSAAKRFRIRLRR